MKAFSFFFLLQIGTILAGGTTRIAGVLSEGTECGDAYKRGVESSLKKSYMVALPSALGVAWGVSECKMSNFRVEKVDARGKVLGTFLLNKAELSLEGNGKKCLIRTERNLNSKETLFRNHEELVGMLGECVEKLGGVAGFSLVSRPSFFGKCGEKGKDSEAVKRVAANLAAKIGRGAKPEDFELRACEVFSQNNGAETVVNVELGTKDDQVVLVSQRSANGKLELKTFPVTFVTEQKMKLLQPPIPSVSATEARDCGPSESLEAIKVLLLQIPEPVFTEVDYTLERCRFIEREDGKVILADLIDKTGTPVSIKAFTPSFSTASSVEFTPADYILTVSSLQGISRSDREEAERAVKQSSPLLLKSIKENAKWVPGSEKDCQELANQFSLELGSPSAISGYEIRDCFTKPSGNLRGRFTLQGPSDLVKVIVHGSAGGASPFTALPTDWVIASKAKHLPSFSSSCSEEELLAIAGSAQRVLGKNASISSVVFTENVKSCHSTPEQLTTVLSFDKAECSANFARKEGKIIAVFGNCVLKTQLI